MPSATWASKVKAVTPSACLRRKATLTFGTQLREVTHNTELLKGWVPQLTAPEVTKLLEFSKFSYPIQISAESDNPGNCSKKRNVGNLKRDRRHHLSGQLACWILSYCLKIWSCQIPTAFDAMKRKWHVVKSNILKMLPWKKGIYCFTLKEC